jgi:hypothetical protein
MQNKTEKPSAFNVWRRTMSGVIAGDWILTSRTIAARTPKEANSKLKRTFKDAGFHSMSLIALPIGEHPKHRGEKENSK